MLTSQSFVGFLCMLGIVTVSAIYIRYVARRGWSSLGDLFVNTFFFLTLFVGFVLAAYVNRGMK